MKMTMLLTNNLESVSWDSKTFQLPVRLPSVAKRDVRTHFFQHTLESLDGLEASFMMKRNVLISRFQYPTTLQEVDGCLRCIFDRGSNMINLTDPLAF